MNTLIKGALGMVLAGAVTFSITSALLDDQSSKRLTEENALPISRNPIKTDTIGLAEKAVKDQTPTTNVKNGQTKLSHDIPAVQVTYKSKNKSDMAVAVIQQNTEKSSKSTTKNPASTNEPTTTARAETTKPATSTKAPAKTTISRPTGTNTTSAATPTPTATTKPATSAKTPTTTTSSPTGTNTASTTTTIAPTPKGTNTPSTTTTNHGQEVSQAAKEKAVGHRDQKENNEKKM